MNYIGKTPLLRARNIEKKLGVKRIYIKLEGVNPTGSKHDRFAKRIVFSAKANQFDQIVADGSKPYLKALDYYTEMYNIELKVYRFKNQKWKEKLSHAKTIDFTKKSKPRSFAFYEKQDFDGGSYRAIEGLDHLGLAEIAYMEIIDEIIEKVDEPIDQVFYTHADDYKTSISNGFLKNYMDHETKIPNLNLVEYDDYSKADITEEDINKAYKLLSRKEHLKLKKKEALPFALFLKAFEQGQIDKGRHVIIIDQAKTRVNISQLKSFDDISKDELLSYVNNYLDRYSDPLEDAKDALENAIKDGFILVASRDETVDGVCVVVHTGFEKFIPTYHLAYIGTNPKSKGRGLGTELIEYAVDLADGKISLHVDLDNYRAKKLYEKMGFKHVYNRMIYQNEE